MSNLNEPQRLFESYDTPSGLRALLEQAHADVPSDAMVEQLAQTAVLRAQMQPRRLKENRWVGRHAGKLVVVAILTGVGTWYGLAKRSGDSAQSVSVPGLQLTPPTPPSVIPKVHKEPDTTLSNEPALQAPVASITKPSPRPRSRSAHPVKIVRTGPTLPEMASPETNGTEVKAGGADEYRLLRSARQAIATDPARAFDLTQEHARRFAHGMLTQEREAIAVEALVQLGRSVQAKTRGQAFLAHYPVSPYRSRVEHALGRLAESKP